MLILDKETEDKIDKYHEIWSFELAEVYRDLVKVKEELKELKEVI